jgi:tRNA A-37 threonylcarbamoyl transferase component Bud32
VSEPEATATPGEAADGWRWELGIELGAADKARLVQVPEGVRALRRTQGRIVYRDRLENGTSVIIKHHRDLGAAERARRMVGSRGATEWRNLQRARHLGLPVPPPLALAERGGETVVVLGDLVDHQPLDEALIDPANQAPVRRIRLAEGLADLLLRVHEAGMQHRDLHPGNLMVPRRGRSGELARELFVLDLHKARWVEPADLEARYADLVDLDLWFAWHERRTFRLRAARRYLAGLVEAGRIDEGECRHLLGKLASRTLEASRRFWLAGDDRARGGNRRFMAIEGGVVRAGSEWIEGLRAVAAERIESPASRCLKSGSSTLAALVEVGDLSAGGEPSLVFLKRYHKRGTVERVKRMLRSARAARAFRAGWALEQRAVPTPRVLGWWRGDEGQSYLVTEAFAASRNLAELLRDDAAVASSRSWRTEVCARIARLTKRMHVSGVSHRDMKTANMLLIGDLGDPQVKLVDLDGAATHRQPLSWERRGRDLARFLRDARQRGLVVDEGEERELAGVYLVHLADERGHAGELEGAIGAALA